MMGEPQIPMPETLILGTGIPHLNTNRCQEQAQ